MNRVALTLVLDARLAQDFTARDLCSRVEEQARRVCNPEREDPGALRVVECRVSDPKGNQP
jgi:hypothetical protein